MVVARVLQLVWSQLVWPSVWSCLSASWVAAMVGTVSLLARRYVGCTVYEVHWTSDASGNASDWLDIQGVLDHAVTVPDSVAAPTTLYDITLKDRQGVDHLSALLANRSATAVEVVDLYRASAAADRHEEVWVRCPSLFAVAAAGNVKKGLCVFYALAR